jgi:hypothetical protein
LEEPGSNEDGSPSLVAYIDFYNDEGFFISNCIMEAVFDEDYEIIGFSVGNECAHLGEYWPFEFYESGEQKCLQIDGVCYDSYT